MMVKHVLVFMLHIYLPKYVAQEMMLQKYRHFCNGFFFMLQDMYVVYLVPDNNLFFAAR